MKNITRLFAIVLLLLTSCNSVNNDTLTLADKVADAFGRTPANMLKKINECPSIAGGGSCHVSIYFTTTKDKAALASAALKVGVSDWGGGDSTSNLLVAIECVEGHLTVNSKCLKERPETDSIKDVSTFNWGGDINHHWTYVTLYEITSSSDIYALDGKPMTENIVKVLMRNRKP